MSGGEDFNPGLETRLNHLKLLGNKALFKYKMIEEASDIDIRRGQKESLPWWFLAKTYISVKKLPQNWDSCIRLFSHNMHFKIALAQDESSLAIKQFKWILKKHRFLSKCIVSLIYLKRIFPWVWHTGLLSHNQFKLWDLGPKDLKKGRFRSKYIFY